VAQRSGSVPPSPRTVKSDPLRFSEERCFDFGGQPSSVQRKWSLSHTSGAVKFPPPSSRSSQIAGFCSGSRLGGAYPSVAQRGWNLPHPIGAVKSIPSRSHDLTAFRLVRCSPVRGATRVEFTTPPRGCQIHAIVLSRSCDISLCQVLARPRRNEGRLYRHFTIQSNQAGGALGFHAYATTSGGKTFPDAGREHRWAMMPVWCILPPGT
jgi:hypothetical protein